MYSQRKPTLDAVVSAAALAQSVAYPRGAWTLDALRGRLVEIVVDGTGAAVSVALGLAIEAQSQRELVAWVTSTEALPHPADTTAMGLDTRALAIVRVRQAQTVVRVAERLLRSGAFGLVILDPGPVPTIAIGALGTLIKCAQVHAAAVVCLTSGREAELGSLVSLRATTARRRIRPGVFECALNVSKDKRQGPGWSVRWALLGAEGLS